MCVRSVCFQHPSIAIIVFADEVPELFTYHEFVVSKKLPDTLLLPWFAFPKEIVRCSEENLNFLVFWQYVGENRKLLQNCLFLRSSFLAVQVPADFQFIDNRGRTQ